MSTAVPSFAVVDRQSVRFDVVNIVRATQASWFDSSGTRWNRDNGVMYGAGNYGARIVSHHATSEAAWAEATERIARAEAAKLDAATRRDAHERIRRAVWRSERAGAPPTDRLWLAAEVIERLASTDDATAERVRDILRGVE